LDPSRRFWPESPSDGSFNYTAGSNWSNERSGDVHWWEVWHGDTVFEAFYSSKPRFVSEFGYQSWPSLPTVKTFCPSDEFDIRSPTMLSHQKATNGNGIIQSMFRTYFKLPKTFEEQLYLSQVQQAFGIRMGCEWYRSLKPLTRGMFYWQLNDCWPGSSWSSIEYSGRWKQLHYHAARFYAPLLATFHEENSTHVLKLVIVSDHWYEIKAKGYVKFLGFDGKAIKEWSDIEYKAGIDSSGTVWQLDLSSWSDAERRSGFFYCQFRYEGGTENVTFDNFFFACRFKDSEMKAARISVSIKYNTRSEIQLTTDRPAFFVHLESDKVKKFSDSSFLMLPGVKKLVLCDESIGLKDLRVYQLAAVGA
jgi:beta-mannosidase